MGGGGVVRREVVLGCGEVRPYEAAVWRDALVVVKVGEVEVETFDGSRARFGAGAVLFFAGLRLRWLRSTGAVPLVLVAVSRRGGGGAGDGGSGVCEGAAPGSEDPG
ncbi:hypothetical protein ACFPZ0_17030 [Streptomonospora nanhaiensis]|uniref:Uncharacterized protein n=1 Tax=Streptomonospora nanhaiensis TaxID=1323731 RepID=A0A853BFU2_9ACTN|nr:hypothetical protein [Streptomonospora nanhaiensis]MBV2366450.1 hypothetical protein [Streptomonospora nanhaiensis]MBX9389269.1 hypothetical protein [Streptomonospora nanhaiensis]NYI94179.1 hypothetical protein [Streptomonospora nanhaiensis]